MNKELSILIKKAREEANLTQEQASEKLNIAWRTLAYYESGQRKIPDDIACLMSDVYEAPVIKYIWLKNTRCGKGLPNINSKNLIENIMSLAINLKASENCLQELMTIGLDGKISAKEKPKYIKIIDTFRLLVKDITLLRFHKNI